MTALLSSWFTSRLPSVNAMMPSPLLPVVCQTCVHLPPAAMTPGIAVIVTSRGAGAAAGGAGAGA
jgi:hypothetical protein